MYQLLHNWMTQQPYAPMVFIWLTGNLTLALIPVVLARWLRLGIERDLSTRPRPRWWLWSPVAVTWLLFLPNTAYLLTEWRHYLANITADPRYQPVIYGMAYPADTTRDLIFLTVFFGAYTLAGLVTLVHALRPIDDLLAKHARRVRSWAIPSILLLCSFGVYVGLVDRLNSWDMLNRKTLMSLLFEPIHIATSPWLATLILSFTAFLWRFYLKTRGLVSLPSPSTTLPPDVL